MPPKKQDLLWELRDHNAFFDMITDMLPHTTKSDRPEAAAMLVASTSQGKAASAELKKGKFHKEPGPESKEGRRAAAKAAKAAAKTAKRRKLNGDGHEEVEDTHSEIEPSNDSNSGIPHASPVDAGAPGAAFPSEDADVTPEQSRIEALRAKLQAKLAALQKGDRPSPAQVSKRAARRAEKRRRQQEQQQKQQKSATNGAANALPNYKLPSGTAGGAPDLDIAATIGFGRLTGIQTPRAGGGGGGGSSQNYLEVNKALANLSKTKNLHKLLADAEAKKAKLEALKQSSDASDLKQAAKIQWSDAMQEAAGTRVKDDPSKIKKVLKKKAAKKKKSEKAWKSRMEQVQQAQDERQRQRTQNLQGRKHKGRGAVGGATVASKDDRNKAPPQGRRLSRPGFEGRKQEFLNGSNKK